MPYAYLNQGAVEIPNIKLDGGISISRERLGDRARTADGTMRQDTIGTDKRTWTLNCAYLTNTQYTAIINRLSTTYNGRDYFWYNEMGGAAATDSVYTYIDLTEDRIVGFGTSTGFVVNGRNITLQITEQ